MPFGIVIMEKMWSNTLILTIYFHLLIISYVNYVPMEGPTCMCKLMIWSPWLSSPFCHFNLLAVEITVDTMCVPSELNLPCFLYNVSRLFNMNFYVMKTIYTTISLWATLLKLYLPNYSFYCEICWLYRKYLHSLR